MRVEGFGFWAWGGLGFGVDWGGWAGFRRRLADNACGQRIVGVAGGGRGLGRFWGLWLQRSGFAALSFSGLPRFGFGVLLPEPSLPQSRKVEIVREVFRLLAMLRGFGT